MVRRTLAVIGLMLVASPSYAIPFCTVTNVSPMHFGSYDRDSKIPLDAVGAITFRCRFLTGKPEVVSVELGRGGSATFFPREMHSGTHALLYNLYLDPIHSRVWGDNTAGTGTYGPAAPPNNTDVTIYIYGRIAAGQGTLAAGGYYDAIVVTFNF